MTRARWRAAGCERASSCPGSARVTRHSSADCASPGGGLFAAPAAPSAATTASVTASSATVARGSLVSAISSAATTASQATAATTIPRRRNHGSPGRSASASAIGAAKLKITCPRMKFWAMYALRPSGST